MNFGGTIRLNRAGLLVAVLLLVLFIFYLKSATISEQEELVEFKKHVHSSDKVNLKQLLIAAIDAAERGGREVIKVQLDGFLNEKSKGKTFEGANDPVTDADMKSHCAMYYSLSDIYPNVQIISEENIPREKCKIKIAPTDPSDLEIAVEASAMHAESVPAEDVTVWIDPLDATQEFTEGLLEYVTTMVCVAVKGVPVIGVIHKPFTELPQTYWSWAFKGMSPNLIMLKHRLEQTNEPAIIVSRSHAGKVKSELQAALGQNIKIIPAGGAGYKVLEVASSNVSAYIHSTKIKKWDICAGNAILYSLGGDMLTLNNGQHIDFDAKTNVVNSDGVFAYKAKNEKLMKIIKQKPENS